MEDTEDTPFLFLDTKGDFILDIYFELKKGVSYNTCFLDALKSTDLSDFFISCLFNDIKDLKRIVWFHPKLNVIYDYFVEEYKNELDISYDIVAEFLSKYKYRLDPVIWAKFCYKHS